MDRIGSNGAPIFFHFLHLSARRFYSTPFSLIRRQRRTASHAKKPSDSFRCSPNRASIDVAKKNCHDSVSVWRCKRENRTELGLEKKSQVTSKRCCTASNVDGCWKIYRIRIRTVIRIGWRFAFAHCLLLCLCVREGFEKK